MGLNKHYVKWRVRNWAAEECRQAGRIVRDVIRVASLPKLTSETRVHRLRDSSLMLHETFEVNVPACERSWAPRNAGQTGDPIEDRLESEEDHEVAKSRGP